jgi:hypothetical protein
VLPIVAEIRKSGATTLRASLRPPARRSDLSWLPVARDDCAKRPGEGPRDQPNKNGSDLRSIKGAFFQRWDSHFVIGPARGIIIQTVIPAAMPKPTSPVT